MLQIALMVVQDISRQLPFTVLPTVQSGWVSMVKNATLAAASDKPLPPPPPPAHPPVSTSPAGPDASGSVASNGSGGPQGTKPANPSPSPTAAPPRPINRARQLKMQEAMSDAARLRWEALEEVEKRAMIQVRVGQ